LHDADRPAPLIGLDHRRVHSVIDTQDHRHRAGLQDLREDRATIPGRPMSIYRFIVR
jgi:hypothetical protein